MPDPRHEFPSADSNPYEAPGAPLDRVIDAPPEWVAVRREHIRRETSLRSVGLLYWLGTLLFGLMGGMMVVGLAADSTTGEDAQGLLLALAAAYIAIAVLFAVVGWGFRRLSPWVRWLGGILSALGLLGFPLGTLINGYILFLLFSPKGARVFADDYAAIRAATPDVRFQRRLWEKLVLGVVLVALLAVLAWILWAS